MPGRSALVAHSPDRRIGDPTVDFLFDIAVYVRGAMTLQALRNEVGDRDFFRILRAWAAKKSRGNGTIQQFIALAERISGEPLDKLFDVWLFTAGKPALEAVTAPGAAAAATRSAGAPPVVSSMLERLSKGEPHPLR